LPASAITIKLSTKSVLRTFLVIRNPVNNTNGIIDTVPVHQLADWFIQIAVIATEIAAGLKICFFFMVRIYFEAIAITDAQKMNNKYSGSFKESGGVIIRASIRAVIYDDSTFAGALKILENKRSIAQHITKIPKVEMSNIIGL
jgi:hypothetical protein